ncbi:MAG: hypothetical protein M3374_07160, partial [Pseudomonadota bacterium]|nr:hypothetical protein [Pseudomonadota bacterium]
DAMQGVDAFDAFHGGWTCLSGRGRFPGQAWHRPRRDRHCRRRGCAGGEDPCASTPRKIAAHATGGWEMALAPAIDFERRHCRP